jgi:two-component system, OmpR family, alkaline phosphatase synthesis response regulator PhoP
MANKRRPEDARTILVADDDPQILSVISRQLGRLGYRVIEAADGAAALAGAKAHHPDLILLDVLMPHMNGWEVARAVRQDPTLKDTPIVVLTAIGHAVSAATSPLFADAYLDKPFEFADLERTIAAALAARRG